MLEQIDLHGLHVDEALRVLESHLIALGGLNHPGGTLIQVCCRQALYGMSSRGIKCFWVVSATA